MFFNPVSTIVEIILVLQTILSLKLDGAIYNSRNYFSPPNTEAEEPLTYIYNSRNYFSPPNDKGSCRW